MNLINRNISAFLALGILIMFAMIIHIPFHFDSLYGEQDTARLVNDALIWLKADLRTESLSEYRFYISPGYIWLAKQVASVSQLTSVHPAFYLNTLNTLAAILIVFPTFFFFKRLVGSEGALMGAILLSVIPTFWQAGMYGFPHLLSMFFMVCALLLYDRCFTNPNPKVAYLLLINSLLTIVILLKADIYLSVIAVFGLMIYRQRLSWRNVLVAIVILMLPILVSAAISQNLLQDSPTMIKYMERWNVQYKPYPEFILSPHKVEGVFMSMGFLSIPVFLISLIMLIRTKRYSLASLLLLWALVPLCFWFFRSYDSSRHHFQISMPIALGISTLLSCINLKKHWRYSCLVLLIFINYFYYPPSSSTGRTSGNLAQSSKLIKERVSSYHRMARKYATKIDVGRKVILGSFTNPYVDAEVLYNAESVESVKRWNPFGYDAIDIHYTNNGKQYLSSSVRVNPEDALAAAITYRNVGYMVYSMEYDIRNGKRNNIRDIEELKIY